MQLFSIFGLYWMFTCDHLCMKGSITIVFDTKRFPCRHHKWHHGCWYPKLHQIMLVVLWYRCQIITANQTYTFERFLLYFAIDIWNLLSSQWGQITPAPSDQLPWFNLPFWLSKCQCALVTIQGWHIPQYPVYGEKWQATQYCGNSPTHCGTQKRCAVIFFIVTPFGHLW